MYRIMNDSARSFIVKADQVLKGGVKSDIKGEKIIPGGKSIVEVTDSFGKFLSGYAGVTIVEIVKDKKEK